MTYDAFDDHCDECGNQGWMWDDLSRAMGGRPYRYCDCPHGERAIQEDIEKQREKERQNPYKKCPTCGVGKVKKDGDE